MSRLLAGLAYRLLSMGGRHRYISTYCQHGQCNGCRLGCKTCQAPCLHRCHEGNRG